MKSNLAEVGSSFSGMQILAMLIILKGKSIRDGMGQASNRPSSETLDLVITNALIVDWSGIYKVCVLS